MKYLLIDGNNLAIRCAFANDGLKSSDGTPTGVHYGVFQSLITLKETYPEHQICIVWDGKSKRRMIEANAGVEKGLIKSGYKANRKTDEPPQPLLDFYEQSPYLQRAIHMAGIPQVRNLDYETDDVIASYCENLDAEDIVCVTTDKDYYQLLDDNISMSKWSEGIETVISKESFVEKNKIEPKQHVDCGALSGDTGDNIFGIPGWGEKGALKAIQKYSKWEDLYVALHAEFDSVREEHPDVKGDEFEKLRNIRTPKEQEKFDKGEEWKGKYPEITEDTPFTGVALAFEEKRWKPKKTTGIKANITALMFEERVKLAYSLKKMDKDAPLPEIKKGDFKEDRIAEYLDYYEMNSLEEEVNILK